MAKKMIAVLLVCIVVVGALQVSSATESAKEAKYEAKFENEYRLCYEKCEKECLEKGNGQSFCEVKCDEDCGEKEAAGMFSSFLNHFYFLLIIN